MTDNSTKEIDEEELGEIDDLDQSSMNESEGQIREIHESEDSGDEFVMTLDNESDDSE